MFCKTHPHLKRNIHQSNKSSWKKNFKINWHIHASIFEQSLRKILQLNKVDITVDESDLAFCIQEHKSYFEACLKLALRNLDTKDYTTLKVFMDLKNESAKDDVGSVFGAHDNMLYTLEVIPSKNRLRVLSRREAAGFFEDEYAKA